MALLLKLSNNQAVRLLEGYMIEFTILMMLTGTSLVIIMTILILKRPMKGSFEIDFSIGFSGLRFKILRKGEIQRITTGC